EGAVGVPEAGGAAGRLRAAAAAAGVRGGRREGRLADAVEARRPPRGRLGAHEQGGDGFVRERAPPQSPQLRRRPWQYDERRPRSVDDEPRRGTGEAERARAVRERGLLEHTR